MRRMGQPPRGWKFCVTALQSICKNILITELIYTVIILKSEVGKFYLVKESFWTSPQEKNVFNQMERVLKFYVRTNSTCFECSYFWGLHVSCTFKNMPKLHRSNDCTLRSLLLVTLNKRMYVLQTDHRIYKK